MKHLGEARFLYGNILTLSNKLGYCYAPNDFLADIMECDVRSITRYIKALEKAKLIKVFYAKNNARTIQAVDTMIGNRLIKNDNKPEINSPIDPVLDAYLDDLWKSMKVGSVKRIK
jgi:DNA-binding MarR family transcriptional regulator